MLTRSALQALMLLRRCGAVVLRRTLGDVWLQCVRVRGTDGAWRDVTWAARRRLYSGRPLVPATITPGMGSTSPTGVCQGVECQGQCQGQCQGSHGQWQSHSRALHPDTPFCEIRWRCQNRTTPAVVLLPWRHMHRPISYADLQPCVARTREVILLDVIHAAETHGDSASGRIRPPLGAAVCPWQSMGPDGNFGAHMTRMTPATLLLATTPASVRHDHMKRTDVPWHRLSSGIVMQTVEGDVHLRDNEPLCIGVAVGS
jgi:hypothetical protein